MQIYVTTVITSPYLPKIIYDCPLLVSIQDSESQYLHQHNGQGQSLLEISIRPWRMIVFTSTPATLFHFIPLNNLCWCLSLLIVLVSLVLIDDSLPLDHCITACYERVTHKPVVIPLGLFHTHKIFKTKQSSLDI